MKRDGTRALDTTMSYLLRKQVCQSWSSGADVYIPAPELLPDQVPFFQIRYKENYLVQGGETRDLVLVQWSKDGNVKATIAGVTNLISPNNRWDTHNFRFKVIFEVLPNKLIEAQLLFDDFIYVFSC